VAAKVDAFEAALAAIKKSMPHATPDDGPVEVISTGSIAVDITTVAGGVPRGRITEIAGWQAGGKTTLCLSLTASAIRQDLRVVYLDPEQALDHDFAARQGVVFEDNPKAVYLAPHTFEECMEAIYAFSEGGADLIVVDSVSAMVPKETLEGDIGTPDAVARKARLMSSMLPRLLAKIRESDTALVLINQYRETISTGFADRFKPKKETTGGMAIRFYSSMRLEVEVQKRGVIKRTAVDQFRPGQEIEMPVANEHKIEVVKNKVGAAYRRAPFWIRYDEVLNLWGVDNVQTLLDMAVAANVIDKRKGGFYAFDGVEVRGEESMHQHLLEHPEIAATVAEKLGIVWAKYAPYRPEVS
jgi:recombination protein RecA